MPLSVDPDRKATTECGCGASFPKRIGWYAHLEDCPLLRCLYCLRVLRNGHPFSLICDDPATHTCPHLRQQNLESERTQLRQLLRRILDDQ